MTLFKNILFVFLLCLGTTQQTVADQLPKALPGGLEELWQGGDRCGEPTLEQWVLTLAMDDSTAALVVDGAKVIPYRFTVEDLIAARSGGPGGTSGSVPPPLEAKAEDGSGGLIYMKARFYDPEIGRFLTQDPAAGDLAVPISLNKYLYAHSNPTAYVDPTGEAAESIWDAASLAVGLASLGYNLYQGNYRDAGLDTLGVLADSAALATPFLPGGAGMAIKGSRAGMATVQQVERARDLTRAVDTVQAVDQTVTVVDSTDRAVDSLDEGHFGEAAFNAGAAMLGARGSVANTGDAWRARRLMEAPTPRGPPQATIVGESAGGPGATLRPTRHGGPDPAAVSSYRPGEFLPDGRIAGHGPGAALRNGPDFQSSSFFGNVTARTAEEAAFLRNASVAFKGSSVFTSATRFSGNIFIQRSDIPWSIQNVRRMANGHAPFIKNARQEWEKVNLHHVGRQDSKLIEVSASHNVYSPSTGGPLHIPGPGGPLRDPAMTTQYWQQRLYDATSQGIVPSEVLEQAGLH